MHNHAVIAAMEVDGSFPPEVDVQCLAGAMVDGFGGAENMEAQWGLTPATVADGQDINDVTLPKDEALSMADGMMSCGLMEVMVSEFTGDGVTEEAARCLMTSIDQNIFRDVFAFGMMDEIESAELEAQTEATFMPAMLDAMGSCDIDISAFGG